MTFRISRRASADLDSIWEFIATDSPSAADRVDLTLHNAMKMLADFPGIGHTRRDIQHARYRFFSVYDYIIAYRIRGSTLIVVRVIHGRRDFRRLFGMARNETKTKRHRKK